MRILISLVIMLTITLACNTSNKKQITSKSQSTENHRDSLAYTSDEIKNEALRTWSTYKKYAWGYDLLLPLSKSGENWYEETIGMSPFDAYSTLAVMGLHEETALIEGYALEKNWNQDTYVQVFEVNIRILGGLLVMYDYTKNPEILKQAIDFGDRLMPAFDSPTGLPYHSVNLKTGKTSGDKGIGKGNVVNVAQAASYIFEFGILSYYAKDPKYYQAAKKATKAIFDRKSKIGLPGDFIDVETGEWTNDWSYLQAGVDSYYEYMLKSTLLFQDPEIQKIWDFSFGKINQYLAEDYEGKRFYPCVNMHTGEILKRSVSLYDAFFPAIQALAGDVENAEKNMRTWDWLWGKYGLLPTRYNYDIDTIEYANSELNPEIIESAYYLHQITGKKEYLNMSYKYWKDIKTCCRNEVAFNAVEDVRTMKAKDYLESYFFAETLKYFYITTVDKEIFSFDDYVFSTEAHPFKKSNFDKEKAKIYLGFN